MNPKETFWTLINVFILVLIILGLAGTSTMLRVANSTIASRTITVQGQGEVKVVPDIAQFNFSAIAEAGSSEEAEQQASQVNNQILAFLKENGVDEKDIKTTGFNVFPRYEYQKILPFGPDRERQIVGYEARQSATVKVRDLDKAGSLLSGVTKNGASQVSSLNFQVEDLEAQRAKARQLAFDDAFNKASIMAKQAGVKIARIVTFSEGFGGPIYAARAELAIDGLDLDEAVIEPVIEPGQEEITVNVSVTYEIR